MADYNQPQNTTLYSLVLGHIRSLISDVARMHDGTTTDNVPVGAKKYNSTNDKFQAWNGTAWNNLGFHAPIDAHIGNAALHSGVPTGTSLAFHGTSAPSGFLLEDGSTVSRVTYAALFAVIGTRFGAGDGSTTFRLPDSRGRSYVGLATSGIASTMGGVFGATEHIHGTPAHTHTVPAHSHGLGGHTHTVAAHTHTQTAHTHGVPAHCHNTRAAGADIQIAASGAHNHNVASKRNPGVVTDSSGAGNYVVGADQSVGTNDTNKTLVGNSASAHAHPNTSFSGVVGLAAGANGDAEFATTSGNSGAVVTGSGGSGVTGGPSVGTTDAASATSTPGGEGGGVTAVASHACIVATRIIKT